MQETQDNTAKNIKKARKLAFNKILLISPLTPKIRVACSNQVGSAILIIMQLLLRLFFIAKKKLEINPTLHLILLIY